MDLQTRKLDVIEFLIGLQDEALFGQIEQIINQTRLEKDNKWKPLSQEDILQRAKKSNEDYLSGNYKTQEQLEEESRNW